MNHGAQPSIPDPHLDLVVIQRNPTSGTGRGARHLNQLIGRLREHGFRVRMFSNRERLDAYLRNETLAKRLRCIVAAGGDGTIGNLVNRHCEFPIATLPLGTENLVAQYLKIARCGRTVADMIAVNATQRFDTGIVGTQRFLLMASVGIDADVVRRLHSVRTGNIRRLSYISPIWKSFFSYQFPQIHVASIDGRHTATGTHVIVTNIPEYGFGLKFSVDADPQDGLLDVRVLQNSRRFKSLVHGGKLKLGMRGLEADVLRFQAREIKVWSDREGLSTQCDGDPGPGLPAEVRVEPSSMQLVVRSKAS